LSPLRQGILGVTSGDWSEGGLSSSSAIGVAYLLALEDCNPGSSRRKEAQILITPTRLEPPYVGCYGVKSAADNIQLDQYIENQYLGLNNGILDQAAILCSRQDHLTVIDCLAYANQHGKPTVTEPSGIRLLPRSAAMPPFVFLVVFSGLTKSLVTTAYNLRVQECATAARILLDATGRPEALRLLGQVAPEEYDAGRHRLSGAAAKRAAHFFSESARVRAGLIAWQQGDLPAFGRLMNESCQSSIENYECGSPPLIDLWRILSETPGIHGARFSGAGFRGCCVALADPASAAQAGQEILAAYARKHPQLAASARALVCQSADGAGIVSP
jgi:galacturonokinase